MEVSVEMHLFVF